MTSTSSRWDVMRAKVRRSPGARMGAHLCHARDCEVPVSERMLMCHRHWAMVPREIQRLVRLYYVPGQETRKDPSLPYIEAAQSAIDVVFAIESRGALRAAAGQQLGFQL